MVLISCTSSERNYFRAIYYQYFLWWTYALFFCFLFKQLSWNGCACGSVVSSSGLVSSAIVSLNHKQVSLLLLIWWVHVVFVNTPTSHPLHIQPHRRSAVEMIASQCELNDVYSPLYHWVEITELGLDGCWLEPPSPVGVETPGNVKCCPPSSLLFLLFPLFLHTRGTRSRAGSLPSFKLSLNGLIKSCDHLGRDRGDAISLIKACSICTLLYN